MTIDEYFGNWMKVIDRKELNKVLGWLNTVNPNTLCPSKDKIFRAFELCDYDRCKIILLSQDPYPQKGVAQGLCFANNKCTPEEKLSPSLQVIKESVINFEIPHNVITFDNSLEDWAKQGLLLLNSALTCEMNKVGSHVNYWRPFIGSFLRNLSSKETGIIFMLFGNQAKSLKPYIRSKFNYILESEHPAYYARMNKRMPGNIFEEANAILNNIYGETINWYYES